MTDKLEEVARAIATDNGDLDGYTGGIPLDGFDYESAAKAAIKAMREPTDEMIRAAASTDGMKAVDGMVTLAFVHGMKLPEGKPSPLLQAWQAMIDTVLEGKA